MDKVAYIIFRRTHRMDDLESGTFNPILVTLDKEKAFATFYNIKRSVTEDKEIKQVEGNELEFEYQRKSWYYEYKIRCYTLDKFGVDGYINHS